MLLLLADGPILQRASSVHTISRQSLSNLTVSVSPSPFVLGATGIITTHDGEMPNTYTTFFAQVMQQYSARNPILIPNLSYPGTVTMSLLAPGWDIQCDNGSSPYELMTMEEWEQYDNSRNSSYDGPPITQTVFETSVDFGTPIVIQSSYKSTLGGNGTQSWRNCSLSEAIVRYPLQVVNGVVALQPMPLSENRTEYLIFRDIELSTFGSMISPLFSSDTSTLIELIFAYKDEPSTIGGLWIALRDLYVTSANKTFTELGVAVVSNENSIANQFVTADSNLLDGWEVAWSDPIDTMIATANEISLRAAIDLTTHNTSWSCATCMQPEVLSPNLTLVNRTISQTVSASIVTSFNAYQTDVAWLISGCAIIALACIAVAPMYWGWWNLERIFTLDPLETAKAFDAPLLRDATAGTSPAGWTRSMKRARVYYGTDQDLYHAPEMTTESAATLADQPLKVFLLKPMREDRSSAVSEINPISEMEIEPVRLQSRVATQSGPKFRKLD